MAFLGQGVLHGGSSADPAATADKQASFRLYPLCVEMGVPGVDPRPFPSRRKCSANSASMAQGYEFWSEEALEANCRVLDEAGLKLFVFWTSVNVNSAAGPAYDARLLPSIRRLQGRPVTLCVLLQGLKPADPQGLVPATKALRELGNAAAEAGIHVSVYQHVNDWTESLPFVLEVVRQVNHPRVGFNFNLCHWLKVHGSKDYRPLLREHSAKLFCVTINGATMGATAWTNGLIRPLDEGDFNNRALLALLDEIDYQGPVGLMCYGIPGDPRDYLARSLQVWRQLHSAAPVLDLFDAR